jgi:hypothetical protein
MRATPFTYVFGEIAARFPAITEALELEEADPTDRDRFVLLEPVGRLLQEIVPADAGADALEAHVLLLHHAYLFWAAGQRIYPISEDMLHRAVADKRISVQPPRASQYLQLPELRMWGASSEESPAEPLDGIFVSDAGAPGAIAILAIFGMRPDRPGFSAVGLEGHADPADPTPSETEIVATREDGSPVFAPQLAGGSAAGLYSLANRFELLLLTWRLLGALDSVTPHEDQSRGG